MKRDLSARVYPAIIFLFIVVMLSLTLAVVTDLKDVILAESSFVFWLVLLTPLLAITSGIIMAHSLIATLQERLMRHLFVFLLTFDVMSIAMLLLFTHPALVDFSPFMTSIERYRSLVAVLGATIAAYVFISVFSGDRRVTKQEIEILSVAGGILPLAIAVWFLTSPAIQLILIIPGTYIRTLQGWLLSFTIIFFTSLSIVRTIYRWFGTRDILELTLILANFLWIYSLFLFVSQTADYQVVGVLWFVALIAGFAILDIGMTVRTVVQPRLILERLVEMRTAEAQRLQLESEFYLNMWSHEVGNLLQGIVHYLELMQLRDNIQSDMLSELDDSAMRLANRATLITRQVSKLKEIKEHAERTNQPVDLLVCLRNAIMTASSMLGVDSFTISLQGDTDSFHILADDLLELVFVNIICHAVESSKTTPVQIALGTRGNGKFIRVNIFYRGHVLSSDVQRSLLDQLDPKKTLLGLDLFTVRLLLDRYSALITYSGDPQTDANNFELTFTRCD